MTEVSVGLGPAQVKVSVPPWRRITQWFRGSPIAQQVRPLVRSAQVQIDRPDEGHVEFWAWLVNLSRKDVTLDRVTLDNWTWSSYTLPELNPVVRGLGVLHKKSVGHLGLKLNLNAAAIRVIKEHTQKPNNPYTTPVVSLVAYGQIYLKESLVPVRYEFQVDCPQVSAVYWKE